MIVVPGVAPSNRVGGPEMLHDAGMVHRDVRCPLLKVPDRVASCLHDLGDQRIRCQRGARRVIHELDLGRSPTFGQPIALIWRQGTNPKLFDAPLLLVKLPLGMVLISVLLSSAVMHRIERFAKRIGAFPSLVEPDRETDQDEGCDPQYDHHSGIHENLRWRTSPGSAGRRCSRSYALWVSTGQEKVGRGSRSFKRPCRRDTSAR